MHRPRVGRSVGGRRADGLLGAESNARLWREAVMFQTLVACYIHSSRVVLWPAIRRATTAATTVTTATAGSAAKVGLIQPHHPL